MTESTSYLSISYWQQVKQRCFQSPSFVIGSILLGILFIITIIGPWISPYNYYDIHLSMKNSFPSATFIFGTDELGRDVFTRTCCGGRISIIVGISAAFIDLIIGVIWGTIAATSKKAVDTIFMRICDVLSAIPHLIIIILLLVFMQPSLFTIIFALTLTGWITMARIVRGQILQLNEMEYILAAQALGASKFRLIFYHLIPNCTGPIITTMTLTIPTAIFSEAFLSFLGLGVQAPIASCGVMINDSLNSLRNYPWRLFFPSMMIFFTMLGFNLLGDGIRDGFDPRM